MSGLLEKYKDVSPTPKQIPIKEFDYRNTERYKKGKRNGYIAATVQTLGIAVCIAFIIFTISNIRAYNKSFDNCVALLEEIEINTAILDQEINQLTQSINGTLEIDYE